MASHHLLGAVSPRPNGRRCGRARLVDRLATRSSPRHAVAGCLFAGRVERRAGIVRAASTRTQVAFGEVLMCRDGMAGSVNAKRICELRVFYQRVDRSGARRSRITSALVIGVMRCRLPTCRPRCRVARMNASPRGIETHRMGRFGVRRRRVRASTSVRRAVQSWTCSKLERGRPDEGLVALRESMRGASQVPPLVEAVSGAPEPRADVLRSEATEDAIRTTPVSRSLDKSVERSSVFWGNLDRRAFGDASATIAQRAR